MASTSSLSPLRTIARAASVSGRSRKSLGALSGSMFKSTTPRCVRKSSATSSSLNRRQLHVAHVTRPACLPNEVKLERLERHVGVNGSGVGFHQGRFKAADHVD